MGPDYYNSYPVQFMALAHPDLPYTVANVGGTHYTAGVTPSRGDTVDSRVDYWLAQYPDNILIDDGGGNELGVTTYPAQTAEEVLAIKRTYCEARRAAGAKRIIGVTMTPGIDLPDSEFWFAAAELEQLARLNDFLRDDPESGGYNKVVDIASIPQLQDPTNTTYFYDGIHYTAAAAALVAQKLADEGI